MLTLTLGGARRHLEFFMSPQALMQTYSSKDPKLILAVPASLSHGPSRALFADFATVPDNVVLLTARGEEGTLGRVLFDKWNNSQRAEDKWDKGKIGSNIMMDGVLQLQVTYFFFSSSSYHEDRELRLTRGPPFQLNSKVPLQGTELELFLQRERAAKEKQAAHQAAMARTQQLLEADEDEEDSDSDSDEEEDEEDVERALGGGDAEPKRERRRRQDADSMGEADWGKLDADDGTKQLLSFDIYLKGNVARATSFFKSSGRETQRFRMFPYVEKKRKVDEYGEVVDVGMWLRRGKIIEEEDEDDEVKEQKRKEEEAKVSSMRALRVLRFHRSNPCSLESSKRAAIQVYFYHGGRSAGMSASVRRLGRFE